jgi:hypothetical protein
MPPQQLRRRSQDVIAIQQVLWRVHRTQGQHVIGWNAFRRYGPVTSGRYDPHPEPADVYPGYGVSYTATDLKTSVAEVFQTTRRIDTIHGAPYATAWTPIRPLRLLDLCQDWALFNGAAAALTAAGRPTCRAWSRAIHDTWPDLDGLRASSTMTGAPMIVMFELAASAMPASPEFSEPLAAGAIWSAVAAIAAEIGYQVR